MMVIKLVNVLPARAIRTVTPGSLLLYNQTLIVGLGESESTGTGRSGPRFAPKKSFSDPVSRARVWLQRLFCNFTLGIVLIALRN